MSDLISRKAILKNIEKIRQNVQMMDDTHTASIIMNGMHLCEEAVMNQPSAQPEPIKIDIEDFNKEDWERLKKEWGNTPITVLPAQPTDEDIQKMQDIEQAMLEKAYECGKQDAARWIPCSERLPEVGRSVLLSVGGMYTAEGCLRDDGDWTQFRWDAIQRKDMVGAWKPLDEPWKREEHEHTMEEFMYGQDLGSSEDGSL